MKSTIIGLALAFLLPTALALTWMQGRSQAVAGSRTQTASTEIEREVKRLATDVAALKTRVSALESAIEPVPTATPECRARLEVNRARVNVREGPGVSYAEIGSAGQGERFEVQASNAQGDWYRFCCVAGKSGWIYAPLVNVVNAHCIPVAADVPDPPAGAPAPAPVPSPTSAQPQWPRVAPENRCSPYSRADYSYPQSVEPRIIEQMGGRIYGPYTGACFGSARETDIEHIVAISEAHDSGMCAADAASRKAFARDLLNLTLASPGVNRVQKGANDVAEWLPDLNACWYVRRVVDVKLRYGLTMDRAESQRAREILNACASTEMQFTACAGGAFTPAAPAPIQGDSCPSNCSEAHDMEMSNMDRDHRCYQSRFDRDGDGIACER